MGLEELNHEVPPYLDAAPRLESRCGAAREVRRYLEVQRHFEVVVSYLEASHLDVGRHLAIGQKPDAPKAEEDGCTQGRRTS